jgi:hypothetical protein
MMLDDEGGRPMRDEVKWRGFWWNNTVSAGNAGLIITLLGGFVGAIFGAGVLWSSYTGNNAVVATTLAEIRKHQDETTADLKGILSKMTDAYDGHFKTIDDHLTQHDILLDRLVHEPRFQDAPAPNQSRRIAP